jgi:hypothetical protein
LTVVVDVLVGVVVVVVELSTFVVDVLVGVTVVAVSTFEVDEGVVGVVVSTFDVLSMFLSTKFVTELSGTAFGCWGTILMTTFFDVSSAFFDISSAFFDDSSAFFDDSSAFFDVSSTFSVFFGLGSGLCFLVFDLELSSELEEFFSVKFFSVKLFSVKLFSVDEALEGD